MKLAFLLALLVNHFDLSDKDIDELLSGRITLKTDASLFPEITPHELNIIRAYRSKPEMQKAVDTLLGIEHNGDIIKDIENTVNTGETVLNSVHTDKK